MKEPTTYNRKYYLTRKVKGDGYQFSKHKNLRLVLVPTERVAEAYSNPAIVELMRSYQYGAIIGSCVHTVTIDDNNIELVQSSPLQQKKPYKYMALLKPALFKSGNKKSIWRKVQQLINKIV